MIVCFVCVKVHESIFLRLLAKALEAAWSSKDFGFTFFKNIIINAGIKVIESIAAKNIVKICVAANGLKSLPSWDSNVKSGLRPITVTKSAENIVGPTSFIASIITSFLDK